MEYSPESILILLDQYNVRALRLLAERLGLLGGEPVPRAALIERLTRFLGGTEHLRAVEDYLGPRHWQVLASPALKEGGSMSLYALRIRLQMLGASYAECLSVFHDLLSWGCLLFSSGVHFSGSKLDIPNSRELETKLRRFVVTFPTLWEEACRRGGGMIPLPAPVDPPVEIREADFSDLQREVFLSLRFWAKTPLRLTTRGLPYKTDMARLAAQVGERGLNVERKRGVNVSARLWFAVSLLESSPLVERRAEGIVPSDMAEEFLHSSSSTQARALYEVWFASRFDEFRQIPTLSLSYYGREDQPWLDDDYAPDGDIPGQEKLTTARAAILNVITGLLPETWVAVTDLARLVRAWDPDFLVVAVPSDAYSNHPYFGYASLYSNPRDSGRSYYQRISRRGEPRQQALLKFDEDWMEVEGAYVAQVLAQPLHWLGLVDLGFDHSGSLVAFRLSRLGRHLLGGEPLEEVASVNSAPPLVVQPNFELIVLDATSNLGLLARLDHFSDRQSLDRAAVYRLTRESLVRGLAHGLTGSEVIAVLEEASRAPLPQNVRYSLEEWARLYESVHLRWRASLLEAGSPAELDRWLADPELAPLLGKRLSPTAVLVPSANRQKVEKAIRSHTRHLPVVDYGRPARGVFHVTESAQVQVRRGEDEPYLRYRLACMADLVEVNAEGPLYRITPASVQRAVQTGLEPHFLVAYLQARAAGNVPADALLRLRGWAGLYPPLRHEAVIALEAPNGFRWEDLEDVPAIRSLLLARVTPQLALARPESFDALRQALAERGVKLEAGLSALPTLASPDVTDSRDSPVPSSGLSPEEALFEAVAQAISQVPPPPPGSGQKLIVSLEKSMLIRFLDLARREGRWINLGWIDREGEEVGATVRPTSLWRRGREHYVNVLIRGGKTMTLALSDVLGVGIE